MLDSENPVTPAEESVTPPPRRRRAASRPAGPPTPAAPRETQAPEGIAAADEGVQAIGADVAEPGEAEAVPPELGEAEAVRADSGEAEAVPVVSGEAEAVRADSGEAEAVPVVSGEAEAVPAELGEAEAVPVVSGEAEGVPAESGEALPLDEPAAPTPTRRSRTASRRRDARPAEPTIEAQAEATTEGAPAAEAPAEVAKPPRRRRSRVTEQSVPAAGAEGLDADVAASLEELTQVRRSRRSPAGRVGAFGQDAEATPDQVLESLVAAIGGLHSADLGRPDESLAEHEGAQDKLTGVEEDLEEAVPSSEAAEDVEYLDEEEESTELLEDATTGEPRRRRRRRGGRRRRRGVAEERVGADEALPLEEGGAAEEAEPAEAEAEAESELGEEAAAETGSRRRRRRRRRGEDIGAAEDDPTEVIVRVREPRRTTRPISDEVTGIEGSTRMEAKKQRRREGRAAGRRRAPILSESEFLARRESVDRRMLIRQDADYSQIAVLEDGVLVEHYVDRASAASMIGNVYLGRIQNVLPSMEAAFVDIGRGRNAVLYAGEVDWDSYGVVGQDKKVEKVFKSGQSVLVQVSKDPVGAKGARLTSHISIPGRYVVYSPGGHLSGISRKLPEPERRRLKEILDALIGDQASVIVRTAAEGASEEELVRDVNRLKAQWEVIEKKVKAGQAPQLLYAEPDLTVRIVRDLFTEDFAQLVVDGNGQAADAYDTVEAYVSHVGPHLRDRLVRWDRTDSGDLFTHHRVHEQVAKALERKVFLPSGGSLIIDRTEAMTVIDVNTGKFTGTTGNLEATVTANNLEAAEEIVRQLRLRDIGGIIVIDFIDMVLPSNRELLLRRLVECLGRDRTRHQVAEVTSLGLVQMTRKKIGTGLAEAFTVPCETCKGRGYHTHDVPVASQAPADGGDRDHSRARTPTRGARPRPTRPAGEAAPAEQTPPAEEPKQVADEPPVADEVTVG